MKYTVTETWLRKYKEFADRYSVHKNKCEYWTNETCTCGFSDDIQILKNLEQTEVKSICFKK